MKAGNEDENKKAAAALVTHLEMVFFFSTAVPRHAQLQLRRIFSCCQGNK